MKPHLAFLLALGALGLALRQPCLATPAAPLDLGQYLTYVRLHRLPDDFPALAAVWSKPALIVDLRYPAGEPAKIAPDALPVRPVTAPLFVLVGPDTPGEALAVLRARAPALITLGLPAPGLTPDIAPDVKPEDDRHGYDALDDGASIESLTEDKPLGPRFDEAALVHEQAGTSTHGDEPGAHVATPPDTRAPAGPPTAPPDAHTAPPPPAKEPKDLVLRRAIQLHRALLALGKLPRK